MSSAITISNIRLQEENGQYRVTGEVDGTPLWFEASAVPLVASGEGFVAAFLYSAMERGVGISIDIPLNAAFLENVGELMAIYGQWWGFSPVAIKYPSLSAHRGARSPGTGLCFSAGADSFYTLRTYKDSPITHLINVHGFDIPLDDLARSREVATSLREISAAVGAIGVMMKSNLRQHPAFTGRWPYSHGGGLVAAAYMVKDIGKLLISASYPYVYEQPWGSHWKTDHLWSSERIRVAHCGAELWRTEKLVALKDDELVQKHLRVCWELKNEGANCCSCEKCLRTMLALHQCNRLESFHTFSSGDISLSVDRLDHVAAYLLPVYQNYLEASSSPSLRRALARLIRRSERQHRAATGGTKHLAGAYMRESIRRLKRRAASLTEAVIGKK